MVFRHGDPLDDFERLERIKEEWLARRPVCKCCKKHIQDEEAFHHDGEFICLECITDHMELIED